MGIIDNLFSTVDSTIDMYGNTEVYKSEGHIRRIII